MESSLPELTRCILRASTHDDYRQIIDHAPGTFSLQEAIANDYNTLCIGQVLPATDHYPQLTIVDLLPTTRALLTHNASTFIVLAPEAILENEKRQRTSHECATLSLEHVSEKCNVIHKEDDKELIYSLEEDAVLEELNAARVIVQVDEHLPSHVCCANEEFMQRIACVFDLDDDDDDNIPEDNDHHNKENHIKEYVNLNGGDSVRCEGEQPPTQTRTRCLLKYNDQEPYLISIGERERRFVFVVYPLVTNCDLRDCNLGIIGAANKIGSTALITKSSYMYLYAGVDVFRNIRAACLRDASYQSHINTWNRQLPFVSSSWSLSSMPTKKVIAAEEINKAYVNDSFNIYYTHTFAIPSDMCSLVPSSMHDDASQCTKWGLAQKVSLCSAIDNFIMTNTYGEEYGDLLSTVMLQCAEQLNNRIVNVGDVITLRLSSSTLNTSHEFDNGERVAEVAWSTLQHYSEKGDAIWADTAESSECTEILFPMRVTEVVVTSALHDASNGTKGQDGMCECEYDNPYGIISLPVSAQNNNEAISLKNKNKLQTEIRLVSQSALTNNYDASPLYVRCWESASSCETHDNAINSLDIVQELREIVNKRITPSSSATFDMMTSRFSAPLVLVIHGIRQNFGYYFVHHVLEHAGIPMAVASVEGLKEEELEELLHKFSSQCSGPAALILHHAERLHDEYTHLLSLIHSSSTTLLSSHSASAHILPWQTNNIVKSDDYINGDNGVVDYYDATEEQGSDTNGGCIKGTKVIVLLCESVEAVAPALAACATNASGVIECSNPSEQDRQIFLTYYLDALCDKHHVHQSMLLSMSSLAAWTVGLTYADLRAFACECVCSVAQKWKVCTDYKNNKNSNNITEQDWSNYYSVLSETDCETCLQQFMRAHGHNLVSTKLQPVRWSDVGGLDDAKRELRETIQLPLLYPYLFNTGMKKRSGILFYGPPGCGKTLLAKAVATEMNMNFMSVKGPELINQYVGESEKNIRLLFQRARDNSPCIVFFDELDALAPARGAKGDAGGAMDRIVAQLLVEVDGVGQSRSDGAESGDIFIISATNRPDLLDPSLLRPGRFDRLCYLGIPATRQEQLYALRALTRKFTLNNNVSFDELLQPLDCIYTGADFFALCSDAMMFAVEDALEVMRKSTTLLPKNCIDERSKVLEHASRNDGIKGNNDSTEHSEQANQEQMNEHSYTVKQKNNEIEDEEDYQEGDDNGNDEESVIEVNMSHFLRARDQLKPSVTREDLRRYELMKTKFTTK